jgi:ribosomal protein S18 acetylase RimI-like enzyme
VSEAQTRAIADNLLRAMQFFGRARKDGDVRNHPGVCVVSCGLNYAAFNAAVLSEPVGADARELTQRIQIPSTYFHPQNLRWTYWLCDDYLDKRMRRDARAIFNRCGMRPLTEAPGMYAERLAAPSRILPDIEVRPVADPVTRTAFAWITSVAFDIPHAICTAIYGGENAWRRDFLGYVGYFHGEPVTTTALVEQSDVVGVYSVGTLPDCRRFGFAEAIMRQVLAESHRRTGVERTVLQSTPAGLRLYERMGYRRITNFNVYITS